MPTRHTPLDETPVVHPLTPERWDDLVRLFGPNGACAGCWCMWWRLPRSEWQRNAGAGNRSTFRALVTQGPAPGLLAYVGGEPVGWCAIEPRRVYPTLQRSRVLKPVEKEDATADGVWSVSCLFVHRRWRRRGLTRVLLAAALEHAAAHGARIVEGYPVDAQRRLNATERFTGPLATFLAAGFREVLRRSPTRPILRRTVGR